MILTRSDKTDIAHIIVTLFSLISQFKLRCFFNECNETWQKQSDGPEWCLIDDSVEVIILQEHYSPLQEKEKDGQSLLK